MDDAHAHPPSPAIALHAQSQSIPQSVRDNRSPTITPKSGPHTHQQRLLQTRHARFTAQSLSVNGINVSFPQLSRPAENDSPYFTSPQLTKQTENAEDSSNASTESAILNEISNYNAYRIRGLKRRAAIPIFQDSPDKHSNLPSVYHDAISDISPPSRPDSLQEDSPTMGLREVSTNLQRPSPGKESPYSRSVRGTPGRRPSQAKLRFNQDEYIEHIENELQSVKNAMYSPTTNLPWKEKMKKAKEENNRLKKDMVSLKVSFEHELQATIEKSAETELGLKRKIKDLEDEVELKDTLIHDLEYDRDKNSFDQSAVEVLRAKNEKLEEEKLVLAATNRDMTKRNDVLALLLAQSPTRTQPGFDFPTPRRRSARPMSLIIPRVPSSPIRTSQTHSRPPSVLTSPALPPTDYFPTQLPSSPLASSPSAIDDARSIDSGLGESCAPVASGTVSRRSTLASHASTSPSIDIRAHARGESRNNAVLRQPSKRRPRKFMPGSTQLKPLLLPTFTAENGHLPLTSPVTSPSRYVLAQPVPQMISYDLSPSRHPTNSEYEEAAMSSPEYVTGRPGPAFQSLDEVFAEDESHFAATTNIDMNRPSDRRQYETPIKHHDTLPIEEHLGAVESHSHPRINSWVLKTITSLSEGTSGLSKVDQMCPLGPDDNVDIPRPLFSNHRTLNGQSSPSRSTYADSPVHPRKRRKTSSSIESNMLPLQVTGVDVQIPRQGDFPGLRDASDVTPQKAKNPLRPRSALYESQGSIRARNPLEVLQQHTIGSRPLASLTIKTVYATLSRYTTYVQGFKRDPLALARRVIANAWRSNWAMFGKLSWWVLGLFIGHRRQGPEQPAQGWENYDGESIADRCCIPSDGEHPVGLAVSHRVRSPLNPTKDTYKGPSDPQPKPLPSASSRKDPKSGWGRSLFLWGKFSVAIMLAVGGAIVQGPGEMLRDIDERRRSRRSSLVEGAGHEHCVDRAENTNNGDRSGVHHQNPIRPPRQCNGQRKFRSYSSPPASPGTLDHTAHVADPSMAIHDPTAAETTQTSTDSVPPDLNSYATDDTLKPARSERRGVHSIFQAPDNIDLAGNGSPAKMSSPSVRASWDTVGDLSPTLDHG